MSALESHPSLKTKVKDLATRASNSTFADKVFRGPVAIIKETITGPVEKRIVHFGLEMVVTHLNESANKDNSDDHGGIVDEREVEMVVLHETATPPGTTAEGLNRRHLSRSIGTSWNYIIDRDGTVHWYIDESQYSAWHAGSSRIFSGSRLNWGSSLIRRKSIGIEMVGPNDGKTPATEAQKEALAKLLDVIERKHNLKLVKGENVFEHTEIAVYPPDYPVVALRGKRGRKSDATGYNTDEILDRMHELQGEVEPPEPGAPHEGDWFVGVGVANVRQKPAVTDSPIAGKVRFGDRINIDKWLHGEAVSQDDWWGHWITSLGFLSRTVLRETPPTSVRGFLRRLEVKGQSAVFARLAPFLENRAVQKAEKAAEPMNIRRLPFVQEGGRGDATVMWDPVLFPPE